MKAQKLDSTTFDQTLFDYCNKLDTLNQVQPQLQNTEEIFDKVDISPRPMNGMAEFYRYISLKIQAPKEGLENRTSGEVIIQFIVNRDGSISEVRAMKGIGKHCNLQAVRIVESSPTWYPGYKDDKPVRVRMILPMNFVCHYSKNEY